MNLEFKREFRAETGGDIFDWGQDNDVVFTSDYVDWLESKLEAQNQTIKDNIEVTNSVVRFLSGTKPRY